VSRQSEERNRGKKPGVETGKMDKTLLRGETWFEAEKRVDVWWGGKKKLHDGKKASIKKKRVIKDPEGFGNGGRQDKYGAKTKERVRKKKKGVPAESEGE